MKETLLGEGCGWISWNKHKNVVCQEHSPQKTKILEVQVLTMISQTIIWLWF